MRYPLLFILSLSLFWFSCQNNASTTQAKPQDSAALAELFENYYQERLKLYPLKATISGDARYNDLLPNNISQAYRARKKAFFTQYRDSLESYDRSQLSPNDQMSYDVLKWECDIELAQLEFPTHLLPINQFESRHLQIGQFASGSSAQPFKTVQDYDNWLKRLRSFATWCDTAIANMRRGMAQGYVLPKSLTVKVIPQFADLAEGDPREHLYYQPILQMPEDFAVGDRTRLEGAYEAMLSDNIMPAFRRMRDFLQDEYLPASRESSGISDIPNGRAYYDLQIKKFTTTDMGADDVFELGKKEVARLLGEMEKVMEEVGYEGDLISFFSHVRERKELMPFSDPQQVIENFNAIHEKMKPQLEKLFDKVPKSQFEVRRTEAFREKSASAEYNSGSRDGTRPGIFYVPIPDVTAYNIYADEDLFLHEAIPGHHYQSSLQQENEALPNFRRNLWYSAYGEGWALYCESLGKELGLYNDPYQYFGMLSAEMHRAIRLVVDAGMHTRGWTREQAIQYSIENEAEPEASIIAEIERYMSWPGQALSYKIGQLKIRELRARAEAAMGDKFDVREFHNQVLEPGCVPLQTLEAKIDRWIKGT